MSDSLWRFDERHPFKGNFDLDKLRAALERHHRRVPLIVITVLNNFACSSPVSMENIREVRKLADAYGIPGLAVSVRADISEWRSYGERDWTAARHFTRRFARETPWC